jgi:hypothetical protein
MLLTRRPLPYMKSSTGFIDGDNEIIDFGVRFIGQPGACFNVSICTIKDSEEEDNRTFQWINYTYFPPGLRIRERQYSSTYVRY